jgi:hypothetical protein
VANNNSHAMFVPYIVRSALRERSNYRTDLYPKKMKPKKDYESRDLAPRRV